MFNLRNLQQKHKVVLFLFPNGINLLWRETLREERERLEENAECRLAIFKDLVGKWNTQEEPAREDHAVNVETEVG